MFENVFDIGDNRVIRSNEKNSKWADERHQDESHQQTELSSSNQRRGKEGIKTSAHLVAAVVDPSLPVPLKSVAVSLFFRTRRCT